MKVLTLRKAHKYLGLIVGVQLLLWTASGLFFCLNPIAEVRGETEAAEPRPLDPSAAWTSPGIAIEELMASTPGAEVMSVQLRPHLAGGVYEIRFREYGRTRWATADAETGRLRQPLGAEEAVALAQEDFTVPAEVAAVDLITDVPAGSEYRGGPLPAFRVTFDHPLGTRLYVSTERALVTARRNDRWRAFDLLWALHIMDYREREDFNTMWLQIAAVLGVTTVASGYGLAVVTWLRTRVRRGQRATSRTASV